jgi:hypothetical protein
LLIIGLPSIIALKALALCFAAAQSAGSERSANSFSGSIAAAGGRSAGSMASSTLPAPVRGA